MLAGQGGGQTNGQVGCQPKDGIRSLVAPIAIVSGKHFQPNY